VSRGAPPTRATPRASDTRHAARLRRDAQVGITLTAANRIFLMEPCIDPAQEIQAAGRIHRLGQTKDCFIKRFAFKDSIEEAVTMRRCAGIGPTAW